MLSSKEAEQTLVLIKPDALKNSLTGYVLSQLSEFHTGLRFAGAKIVHVHRILAEQHYAEHRDKPFFPFVIDYLMGIAHYPDEPWKRRVIALVLHGPDAVKKIREIAGPTHPIEARQKKPGCIRSLGAIVTITDALGKPVGDRMDNIIHASSSQSDAEREIKLWFRPSDIPPAMHAYPTVMSNDHFYYKEGKLYTSYEPHSVCLVAPGETAWQSDLEALQSLASGRPSKMPLEAVAAKYLINERHGSC